MSGVRTDESVVWWDRTQFIRHDTSDETCPEDIDVTGPPRVLVFGPMIVMPAGRLRMTIDFRLSAEAAMVPYNYQLLFGPALVEAPFTPTGSGRYVVPLEIDSTIDAHVAMRLWNSRAAFDGCLWFAGATVELRRRG